MHFSSTRLFPTSTERFHERTDWINTRSANQRRIDDYCQGQSLLHNKSSGKNTHNESRNCWKCTIISGALSITLFASATAFPSDTDTIAYGIGGSFAITSIFTFIIWAKDRCLRTEQKRILGIYSV